MPKTANKSAKTVTPKKAVIKKVVTKSTKSTKSTKVPPSPLVYANNERSFWVTNGQVLNSLIALKQALAEMEKAIYTHHVTEEKNDFADWVEAVLCDAECALALRKAKTPKSAHTAVLKRLKVYQA